MPRLLDCSLFNAFAGLSCSAQHCPDLQIQGSEFPWFPPLRPNGYQRLYRPILQVRLTFLSNSSVFGSSAQLHSSGKPGQALGGGPFFAVVDAYPADVDGIGDRGERNCPVSILLVSAIAEVLKSPDVLANAGFNCSSSERPWCSPSLESWPNGSEDAPSRPVVDFQLKVVLQTVFCNIAVS